MPHARNPSDHTLISRDRWTWSKVRAQVIARDGGTCVECGGLGSQVDHIIERAHGGTDHLSNLRLLCVKCHTRRRRATRLTYPLSVVRRNHYDFPVHECRALNPNLPALRGDYGLGVWHGDGCPSGCSNGAARGS